MSRVDVIIPTLNAASGLGATLAGVAALGELVGQVIVVDGGSVDETASVARAAGAVLLTAPAGRGGQLRRGAAAARAAWLLFLHADSVPGAGAACAMRGFLAATPGHDRAGYFRLRLDDDAPSARRLEAMVAWRCRVLALPYGDQGLLIPAALYHSVGGFADIALMEDVALGRSLGRRRLRPLPAEMVTSARRYISDGYLRRASRNLVLLGLYLCGVAPDRLAALYDANWPRRRFHRR